MDQFWIKKPISSGKFRAWLVDSSSLTAKLQRKYANFNLELSNIQFGRIVKDEFSLMHLPVHKTVLVREALLIGNNHPVVFAHSVLPRASLRGAWQGLGRLGNKPLGAMLFANPVVKRTPLRYKKLLPHHKLYLHATAHLTIKPTHLWARRSIFSLNCAKIMVTEVFLPQLLK